MYHPNIFNRKVQGWQVTVFLKSDFSNVTVRWHMLYLFDCELWLKVLKVYMLLKGSLELSYQDYFF